MTSLIGVSHYLSLSHETIGNKTRSVIGPSERAEKELNISTEFIGMKFPSIIKPVIKDPVRKSHKNVGKTIVNDTFLNAAKRLSETKFRINKTLLQYLMDNRADWMTPRILPYERVKNLSLKYGYKKIMTNYQKFCFESYTLDLGKVLQKADYFYYSIFLD